MFDNSQNDMILALPHSSSGLKFKTAIQRVEGARAWLVRWSLSITCDLESPTTTNEACVCSVVFSPRLTMMYSSIVAADRSFLLPTWP